MLFHRSDTFTHDEDPSPRRRVVEVQPRTRPLPNGGAQRRINTETPIARALGLHDCQVCHAQCGSAEALQVHRGRPHGNRQAHAWRRVEGVHARQNEGLSGMRGSNFAGAAAQASLHGYWEIGWVPDNDSFTPDPVIASYYRARGGFLTSVNGRRFW
jgi:hypothetical protein